MRYTLEYFYTSFARSNQPSPCKTRELESTASSIYSLRPVNLKQQLSCVWPKQWLEAHSGIMDDVSASQLPQPFSTKYGGWVTIQATKLQSIK